MTSAHVKRTILVPLDGSELAETILQRIRPLAGRAGDETLLIRVAEPGADNVREAQAYLDRVQERLSGERIASTAMLRVGDAAEQILITAAEHRPDFIALSTHGRSGPARWVRGSVAERVLRHANQPVLMANPAAMPPAAAGPEGGFAFGTIVVAVDGSDRSVKILPVVKELAGRFESEIVLAHVVVPPAGDEAAEAACGGPPPGWLTDLCESVSRDGLPVRLRVEAGPAAAVLLDLCENEPAHLLALTTHGRTGVSRWVFGSVAEKVLRHAPCPVLALRTAERPPA